MPKKQSAARSAATVVLVAVAYWCAAKLAILLALPPGYATAVWPSAGIALAATLIWGPRGLIGAAIGSLTWNTTRLVEWPGSDRATLIIAQVLGITLGITLQAIVGAWLIRKAVGQPLTLLRDHHVIKFMALGGPVSCLIGATVGVGTLVLAGTLRNEELLFSWFVWWVGDCIGVLTAAPLVLMFFGEPREIWRQRRIPIGVPMVVTFAVAVFAFIASSRSELRQERGTLERRADAMTAAFRARVLNAASLVHACAGLYRSSEEVTPQEFSTFALTLLRESSGIKALSHIDRIADSERAAFEEKMRTYGEGYKGFSIRDVVGDSNLSVSPSRPFYFVITAIEPLNENRPALGVDIASRAQSLVAMNRAIETGSITVTERVQLIQDESQSFGVVIYLPHFDNKMNINTPEARRAAFRGLNGAVVHLSQLVATSTTRFDLQEITLQLLDITEPSRPQSLYIDARPASELPDESVERLIEIGGRVWQLKVSRIRGLSLSNQSLQSWMVLAGGLMLTSLLGGLLMILTGRAALIASLVRERTSELSTSNAQLAAEQAASVRMMEQLKSSRDAAEEADRTKTAFLANMTHEIRTPMTAILGYTDLLLDPQLSSPVRNQYAEVIRRNGEHLLEIVNDILDISKIEAGKLAIETIPCSLDEIARDVQNMMQPRAQKNGIGFSVEWKGDTSRAILTDPIRIRQILINLVSNAIKFTQRGGVTMRIERLFDSIHMTVTDTGIGMSQAQIERVFQPFVQGDSSTTRRFGGTGLGLAISRHLSRLLGGELDVESAPGKGSTFRVTLPAVDVPEADNLPPPEPLNSTWVDLLPSVRGKRLLLAEDSTDVREFLRQVLTRAGIEVTAVANGEQLLDASRNGKEYDLILVDMQMPSVDGYEATRRIRAAGFEKPIIAITAHSLESDRTASLAAGCSDYIRKPVRSNQLLQRVAMALGIDPAKAGNVQPDVALRSELLDDPIIADLLPTFFGELEKYAQDLREAVAVKDANRVRQLLHNVTGAAGTFGFPRLVALAVEVSTEMRTEPWSDNFHLAIAEFYEMAAGIRRQPTLGTKAN
jgi:signal transduction histidine kinase/CheY-like chemotaxis protein/HPt (histidine-containing phosphotransfer) domain-containing protein